MPDYHLAGLSPRAFEQLVQALARKFISPLVLPFGDGPDGGRDAVFDGETRYGRADAPWRGYGVVQAKFLEKPRDATGDGRRALACLKKEIAKYFDPERRRRMPEYYVFATSVALSSKSGDGFKDRAVQELARFKARAGLKGFDLWDGAKIARLLDGAEDIRHAFAAWITPGDVLAAMFAWLRKNRETEPDFQSVLTRFLQKELLADQYVEAPRTGLSRDRPISLAKIFVDLPVAGPGETLRSREAQCFVGLAVELASRKYNGRLAAEGDGASLPRPTGLALLGGAGQGKTSLGQFLCQWLRAALLERAPRRAAEVRRVIGEIRDACRREGLGPLGARRFPLRVAIDDFADKLASPDFPGVRSLLGYIAYRIGVKAERPVDVETLRRWLRRYPWLMVLDGLDEVAASKRRDEALQQIREFRVDVHDLDADVFIVVAGRPADYGERCAFEGMGAVWLAPMDEPMARRYGHGLIETRLAGDDRRRSRVHARFDRAMDHPLAVRLLKSPLQAAVMAILLENGSWALGDNWSLFSHYLRLVNRRERRKKTAAARALRERPDLVEKIHRDLALAIHVGDERGHRIGGRSFAAIVRRLIRLESAALNLDRDESARLELVLVHGLLERPLLLSEPGLGGGDFELRSFREFLAAEALFDGDAGRIRERLALIGGLTHWRNVFLFLAGRCFVEEANLHLRDLVFGVCSALNESGPGAAVHTMAGSRLALVLLEDEAAWRGVDLAKSLARLALRLLDCPLAETGAALARIYRPAAAGVFRQELERRLFLPLPMALGAWRCLERLMRQGAPWAEPMAERHWPSVPGERAVLFEVLSPGGFSDWLAARFRRHLPLLRPAQASRLLAPKSSLRRDADNGPCAALAAFFGGVRQERHELRGPLPGLPRALRVRRPALDWGGPGAAALGPWLADAPPWRPFLAVSQFAREPSPSTLAEALRALADTSRGAGVEGWQALPLPLAACWAAAEDRETLRRFADLAERGSMGAAADWAEAQARWRRTGVRSEDLRYQPEHDMPFDRRVGEIGFPIGPFAPRLKLDALATPDLRRFAEFSGQCCVHARQVMAEQVLPALWKRCMGLAADQQADREALLRLYVAELAWALAKARRLTPTALLLSPLLREPRLAETCERFLTALSRHPRLAISQDADLSQILAERFVRRPDRPGLFRAAVSCMNLTMPPAIPAKLADPLRFEDPQWRRATLRYGLVSGGLTRANSEHWTALAVAESRRAPSFGVALAQCLATARLNDPLVDSFLARLQELIPKSGPGSLALVPARQEAIRALQTRWDRRGCGLGDPETWVRLGFSEALHALLVHREPGHEEGESV